MKETKETIDSIISKEDVKKIITESMYEIVPIFLQHFNVGGKKIFDAEISDISKVAATTALVVDMLTSFVLSITRTYVYEVYNTEYVGEKHQELKELIAGALMAQTDGDITIVSQSSSH